MEIVRYSQLLERLSRGEEGGKEGQCDWAQASHRPVYVLLIILYIHQYTYIDSSGGCMYVCMYVLM